MPEVRDVDGAMTDYRKLPAVEPIEPPSRFSQTLLAKHDDCPRSSYLYLKHRGGTGAHNMDRGSLAHEVFERALKTLVATGERQFSPEDPEQAASMMAAIVDEVLRDRPDLVVPRREVDDVREMAYHWAVGYDVDPEHVAGIEQLMVLDLECGWTISGKLDVIALPSVELGQVDDYKSGQALPTAEEYEGSVQPWVYAVLLLYGTPVTREGCYSCEGGARVVYRCESCGGMDDFLPGVRPLPCTTCEQMTEQELIPCPRCDGKGYRETRGEPGALGGHLKGVLTREVYPRPKLRDDGTLHRRELLLARTAIADYRADLERMAFTLGERFKSWDFPARSSGGSENGSWCSRCPAPHECPLPEQLRDFAGTVNTLDEATEAWTKVQHDKARNAAIEREVKNFCKAHNATLVVGDQQWRWEPTEGRALKKAGRGSDWDGLEVAVRNAAEYGEPFDVAQWVLPTTSNGFRKSKVTSGETR